MDVSRRHCYWLLVLRVMAWHQAIFWTIAKLSLMRLCYRRNLLWKFQCRLTHCGLVITIWRYRSLICQHCQHFTESDLVTCWYCFCDGLVLFELVKAISDDHWHKHLSPRTTSFIVWNLSLNVKKKSYDFFQCFLVFIIQVEKLVTNTFLCVWTVNTKYFCFSISAE